MYAVRLRHGDGECARLVWHRRTALDEGFAGTRGRWVINDAVCAFNDWSGGIRARPRRLGVALGGTRMRIRGSSYCIFADPVAFVIVVVGGEQIGRCRAWERLIR